MQPRRRRAGRGTFIAASHALVVVFVASSAPLPLFNSYRTSLGLTNADISVVVVGYFAGTIGALLFLGRLASHVGRKPAAMSALVLLAIGCLVLVGVDGLAPLVAGRVLMGLGAGLASSSITAYIVDAAPARPPWLASVASSQALNLGMTVGALGAGVLVMFAPWPTRLVYVLATMWLIVCIVLVAVSVETDERRPGAWASLRPRVRFAPRARRLVPVASVILFSTWAMGAFYQAFVPSIVSDQLGTTSALAFAVVFCAYMLPNVIGAPISGLLRPAGGQRLGMLIFITGVGTILLAIQAGSLPLFILGSLLGGTGQGVSISSSVRAFLGCTTPSERAPLFAGIYLIGYSGSAIPTLVSGQISHVVALPTLALGYGALSLAAAIFTLVFARDPGAEATKSVA